MSTHGTFASTPTSLTASANNFVLFESLSGTRGGTLECNSAFRWSASTGGGVRSRNLVRGEYEGEAGSATSRMII